MKMPIDREFLNPFCGDDPTRYYLQVPFNQDGFAWATNGHILVRVPEMEGLLPCSCPKPINISKPLTGFEDAQFSKARWKLPAHDPHFKGPCIVCDGRGVLHDCPECDCICEACKGTGRADPERRTSVRILGRLYALNYVRIIASLPGLEVSDGQGGERPLFYRFDGGIGALMPLRAEFETHFDIEVQ